jgi:hypothetical protein
VSGTGEPGAVVAADRAGSKNREFHWLARNFSTRFEVLAGKGVRTRSAC